MAKSDNQDNTQAPAPALQTLSPAAMVRAWWLPCVTGVAAVLLIVDPTMRYTILVATLPLLQRGTLQLRGLELPKPLRTRTPWLFHVASFTLVVVGWTVMFTILVMAVAHTVFGVYFSFDSMKQSILGGCLTFVIAAWFWWPYYVVALLDAWPRHDKRVFVKSSNRWDTLLEAWRLRRQSAQKWPGFLAVSGVAAAVVGTSAAGAWEGIFATLIGIAGVALLVPLNWIAVREAHALCADDATTPSILAAAADGTPSEPVSRQKPG